MRCVDFRDSIERTLRQQPAGLIWKELKERGRLPYNRPCQTWVKQLERGNGLYWIKGLGRALVWKIPTAQHLPGWQ